MCLETLLYFERIGAKEANKRAKEDSAVHVLA